MAHGAVVHTFRVELSHVDRGIYESLDLRVARHPSENEEFLWARVLAYCLEYREGLAFSKGLAEPDQPALEVRDPTGTRLVWIDVGTPGAERLHRASKAAGRVAVDTHHDVDRYWSSLQGARIHNGESLELYGFDRTLVAALVARLERRLAFELSLSNGVIYLTLGRDLLSGPVTAHRLTP